MKTPRLLDAEHIRGFTRVPTTRNLFSLALDYLTAAGAIAGVVWFWRFLVDHGHSRWWILPVWFIGILIVGVAQHRLAMMGHESSHNLLAKNRKLNDVLSELLCFFPLFSSLVMYRNKHTGHHLHPNDPERDPNLANGKEEALFAKFPMPKRSFIYRYYLGLFWPPVILVNLKDLFIVMTLGSGLSPVPDRMGQMEDHPHKKNTRRISGLPTLLGIGYFIALFAATFMSARTGSAWTLLLGPLAVYAAALAVWSFLPKRMFETKARLAYSQKANALLRLSYFSLLFWATGWVRFATGHTLLPWFLALWVVPLIYTFPYLMLLREIYQHANAGKGALDNSRIIHADPFTRWALLSYGNDYHLIHHLYPNIPHHQLRPAHELLMRESQDYRTEVCETFGTVRAKPTTKDEPDAHTPAPTLLDSLAQSRQRTA